MSEFHATPNTVRHNHAERVFAEKLAADVLNLRSIRAASVLVYTSEAPQESAPQNPATSQLRIAQESGR